MKPVSKPGNMEIFVLDDDRDVREALRAIFQQAGYEVVCFADDSGLVEAVRQRMPACIILDLRLPGKSGIEVLKSLAGRPAPAIVISAHGDIPTAVSAIKSGAVDFVTKPFTSEEIVRRFENAVGPGAIAAKVASSGEKRSLTNLSGFERLTCREREVLEQIAAGSSSKQAGQTLGISYRTVELHRARLLRKLGVRNSTELMIGLSQRSSRPTGG